MGYFWTNNVESRKTGDICMLECVLGDDGSKMRVCKEEKMRETITNIKLAPRGVIIMIL